MPDPLNRVFDIQELLDLLTAQLDRKGLSILARTNHKLYRLCTPLLFRNQEVRDLYDAASHSFKILSSNAEARNALSRNLHYIWKLTLGEDELTYFYNCMLDFQETKNSHNIDTPATSRPTWLPPPDIDTRQLIPLSPMTSLSRLVVSMRKSFYHSYRTPSNWSPRATLAQLSWLISLHSGLASLE